MENMQFEAAEKAWLVVLHRRKQGDNRERDRPKERRSDRDRESDRKRRRSTSRDRHGKSARDGVKSRKADQSDPEIIEENQKRAALGLKPLK